MSADLQKSAKQNRPRRFAEARGSAAHVGFWMETPDGHDVHILGDRKMPARTRKALGAMMDAAYKAALAGKLEVPPNNQALPRGGA